MWKDGHLVIAFEGNRVDVIPPQANEKGAAPAGGSGRVLIDGKRPSEFPAAYRITRPQPGPWSPLFLSRVDHDAPLVLEDWTLRVSHVSRGRQDVGFRRGRLGHRARTVRDRATGLSPAARAG